MLSRKRRASGVIELPKSARFFKVSRAESTAFLLSEICQKQHVFCRLGLPKITRRSEAWRRTRKILSIYVERQKAPDQRFLPSSLSKNPFFDKLSKFFERLKCIKMFEKLVD